MDRRYREAQLSEQRGPGGTGSRGLPAAGQARRDALVQQYLAEARATNRQAQGYGGSTGRPGAVYGAEAPTQRQVVAATRGAEAQARGRIFQGQESPRAELDAAYEGGRSVLARARGFRKPAATA
ncbi:MAG: hypothetical protein VKI63_05995 [Cyanobium sp.]|nr:hypothetical protein [Cyanobium sp.]